MKKITLCGLFATLVLATMGGFAALNGKAYAGTCPDGKTHYTNSIAECGVGATNDNKDTELMPTIKTIINVVLSIVGVIAVAIIIIGGISFITSQGDTGKVAKARNTILYGVVGLVVALLAFAIVNFVLSNVFKSGTQTPGSGQETDKDKDKEQGP